MAAEIAGNKYDFKVPEKQIKSAMEMAHWEKSESYYDLLGFISSMCVALQATRLSQKIEINPVIQKLMDALSRLEQLAIETPPVDQPARFGNIAFRSWFEKVQAEGPGLISAALPEHLQDAVKELNVYFVESFGNATRIDYGTGHELAFVMFLMCLFKTGAIERKDEVAVGLKLFNQYLNLVRKLQVTYRMEPAGSHGVWSLDDFQFVPFIWGSAQLAVNSPIEPAHFVEDKIIDEHKKELMFVSCIDYIRQVKTGHFAEHSNQLWSISAVPSWGKICTGLIKMYQKEVLSKFPVIQHVYFGSILTLNLVKPGTLTPSPRLGMIPRQQQTVAAPPAPPKTTATNGRRCGNLVFVPKIYADTAGGGSEMGSVEVSRINPEQDFLYTGQDLMQFAVCMNCCRCSPFLIYLGANSQMRKLEATKNENHLFCPECTPCSSAFQKAFPGEKLYRNDSILHDQGLLELLSRFIYGNPYYECLRKRDRIIITETTKLLTSYKQLSKISLPKLKKLDSLYELFPAFHRMFNERFDSPDQVTDAIQKKYQEICSAYANLSDIEASQLQDYIDIDIDRTPRHMKLPSHRQSAPVILTSVPDALLATPLASPSPASTLNVSSSTIHSLEDTGSREPLRTLDLTSESSAESISNDLQISSQEPPSPSRSTIVSLSQSQSQNQPSSQGQTRATDPQSQASSVSINISSQSVEGGSHPRTIMSSDSSTSSDSQSSNVGNTRTNQPRQTTKTTLEASSQEAYNISSQSVPAGNRETDTSLSSTDSESTRITSRRRSSAEAGLSSPDPQPGPSGVKRPRRSRDNTPPMNPSPRNYAAHPSARMPRLGGG
ncbi:uncharacterized protein LOC129741930 [Uranotaenia lowii]|uniref:uncharacterized protein LOC129741930 n=1 Tax=Uranotaenia lowii TaxID=190385 RepID=UPI002479FC51|nr:uncharacterized protein LOC129741930 [Uranotaenia lowii]